MTSEHANKCGFKLFGVQIGVDSSDKLSIRKSKSLSNLQTCNPESASATAIKPSGYLYDGPIHQSSKSHDRKKGRPWSEEEHKSFLVGLEKLGKGDLKGIATQYVPTSCQPCTKVFHPNGRYGKEEAPIQCFVDAWIWMGWYFQKVFGGASCHVVAN